MTYMQRHPVCAQWLTASQQEKLLEKLNKRGNAWQAITEARHTVTPPTDNNDNCYLYEKLLGWSIMTQVGVFPHQGND